MSPLAIDRRTLGRLDLEAALQAELQESPSLLPSRSVDFALRDHVEEGASLIAASVPAGAPSATTEVIVAAKSTRGFRPIHLLDIETRVLYRALVDLLIPGVSYPDRGDEAFDRFARAPLTREPATHVVRADVTSFYQYIDHRLLESEVVSQTGDADVAASILDMLSAIMGRSFGLPQNNSASHALAETYIDKVERQLIRSGQDVWRYSDDFAIATMGLRPARQALEDFERCLRSVGLTPNDEKSMIHLRDAYQTWIDRPASLKTKISSQLSIDLDSWILAPASEYEDEDDDEGHKDQHGLAVTTADAEQRAQVEGAVRTLEDWLDHTRSSKGNDPLERHVYRTLARDAIRVLRRRLSDAGVSYCDALLEHEPQLTHTVCRYMSRLAVVNAEAVEFVSELLARPDLHLSTWQKLWLLEPVRSATSVPTDLLDWAEGLCDDHRSALLRARAALALAHHDRISPRTLGALFDESTSATRPDLVVATVLATGSSAVANAVSQESALLRLVASAYDGVR